jgi:CheY-like chemotaxis protein
LERILVVEDDLSVAILLQEVLTDAGYEVRLATDGRQAADILKKEKAPDLVLTDLNLPHIRGAALVELIRSDPNTKTTPVIVATGAAPEEFPRREAYEILIRKPYMPSDILDAVSTLLAVKRGPHLRKRL